MRDENRNQTLNQQTVVHTPSRSFESEATESLLGADVVASPLAYNEMADVPVQWIDPVAQVQKNLAHLQELQARMKFTMREVRYLLKI